VVHHSGTVLPCTMLCDRDCDGSLTLGHLDERPLGSILDGPAARRLRARVSRGELTGLCCDHCDRAGTCNVYGDPVAGRSSVEPNWGEPSAGELGLEPLPPARLELGLTDLCNMRCQMCSLTRGLASPPGLPKRGFLSRSRVEHCLAEVRARSSGPLQVWLHWIGEPLLHRDLPAICTAVAEAGGSIFLVTNALDLDAGLTKHLLELPGHHAMSISLNAWTAETFQRVNGSGRRDRAVANTEAFLEARVGHEAAWDLIVTSVVVADNLHEVPTFVDRWREAFEERGYTPDVVLNGRPASSGEQIMLLSEIERPESPALFREALRSLAIDDALWPVARTQTFDRVIRAGLGHEVPAPGDEDLATLTRLAQQAPLRELQALVTGLYRLDRPALATGLAEARRGDAVELLEWLLEHGDHEEVERLCSRELAEDPARSRLWWLRGRARLRAGRAEAALEDLDRAAADPELVGWVAENRAEALLALDHPVEALASLEAARPGSHVRRLRWQARLQAGEAVPEGAAPAEVLDALARIACARLETGDPETAGALAARVLAHDATHPGGLYALARRDSARGRWEAARERLLAALQSPSEELEPPLRHHLAEACLALALPEEAARHAERARELEPGDGHAARLSWEAQVAASYRRDGGQRAREVLAGVLERLPGEDLGRWAPALYRAHEAGDAAAVIELATTALERKGEDTFVRWLRAAALESLGRCEAARRDLEACQAAPAERLAPIADAVWDTLAALAHREGDRSEAARCAREALAIDPDRPGTRALLEALGLGA